MTWLRRRTVEHSHANGSRKQGKARRPGAPVARSSRPRGGASGSARAGDVIGSGLSTSVGENHHAALGLHAREADAALVGADAVLSDGALVNKVGTRLLAFACERAGTPLYAATDRFKVASVATLPLEEKAPGEVWPDAPEGVGVRNIYFDRTEASLVAGYATDVGTLVPAAVGELSREHAAWAAWEARVRALLR